MEVVFTLRQRRCALRCLEPSCLETGLKLLYLLP